MYGQAAGKAAADLDAADHEALSDKYLARVVELIRASAELLPPASRAGYLRQVTADPAFDLIRHRAEFAKLSEPAAPAK